MKTRKLLIQKAGIRYTGRYAPIWMQINIINGHCWCGTPKEKFAPRQRKYCVERHGYLWYYWINAYWDSFRTHIIQRDNHTCMICGYYSKDYAKFDVDHIISLAMGGECYDETNVRTLCKPCHKIKTKQDAGERSKKKQLNKEQ